MILSLLSRESWRNGGDKIIVKQVPRKSPKMIVAFHPSYPCFCLLHLFFFLLFELAVLSEEGEELASVFTNNFIILFLSLLAFLKACFAAFLRDVTFLIALLCWRSCSCRVLRARDSGRVPNLSLTVIYTRLARVLLLSSSCTQPMTAGAT